MCIYTVVYTLSLTAEVPYEVNAPGCESLAYVAPVLSFFSCLSATASAIH